VAIIVRSDHSRMCTSLKSTKEDRLEINFHVQEAKRDVAGVPRLKIHFVKQEHKVSHELAQLSRGNVHIAVWLRQHLLCIVKLIEHDCNSLLR
jgi:hypothetical protein